MCHPTIINSSGRSLCYIHYVETIAEQKEVSKDE